MLNLFTRNTGMVCAVLMFGVGVSSNLRAGTNTVIYKNNVNDLGSYFLPGTQEVGDAILLSSTNFERYLTEFRFEVYGTNTTGLSTYRDVTNVQAVVRFYLND